MKMNECKYSPNELCIYTPENSHECEDCIVGRAYANGYLSSIFLSREGVFGKWIIEEDEPTYSLLRCSACCKTIKSSYILSTITKHHPECPHCGTKMVDIVREGEI